MTTNAPEKGDIVLLDFNPQAGHEQAGNRPALVLSPQAFNQITGFALVCPVTNQVKGYPFEVPIEGTKKTTGVALADQIKSLDWSARKMKVVDHASDETIKKAVTLISTVLAAGEG